MQALDILRLQLHDSLRGPAIKRSEKAFSDETREAAYGGFHDFVQRLISDIPSMFNGITVSYLITNCDGEGFGSVHYCLRLSRNNLSWAVQSSAHKKEMSLNLRDHALSLNSLPAGPEHADLFMHEVRRILAELHSGRACAYEELESGG